MLLLWVWPGDKKGCVRVHHKFPTCRYGWTAPIEKGSWSMNECLKILAPVGCNIFLIVTKLPARISRRGKGLLWPRVHHDREGTEVRVWGSWSYCVCSQEAELADRSVPWIQNLKVPPPATCFLLYLLGVLTMLPNSDTVEKNIEILEPMGNISHDTHPLSKGYWVVANGEVLCKLPLLLTTTWKGVDRA